MGEPRLPDQTTTLRARRGLAAVLLSAGAALAACGGTPAAAPQAQAGAGSTSGSGSTAATVSPAASTPAAPSSPGAAPGSPVAVPPGGAAATAAPAPAATSPSSGAVRTAPTAAPTGVPTAAAWTITTVYTAVESFHTGPSQAVTGCPPGADECSNGTVALGSYPGDFLDAVRSQGTGRITSGKYAGKYLTWDADSGYGVDPAVVDASERPMRPFVSAGADPGIALGTAFRVLDCGADRASGRPVDAGVCSRIRAAGWTVVAPARQAGDSHALELYVGEEDGPGFAAGPLVVHAAGAHTTLG